MFESSPLFWITIASGLLAVVGYSVYSRIYEPLTRSAYSTQYAATLLYATAAAILAGLALTTAVLFGWRDPLATPVTIFDLHVTGHVGAALALIVLILLMSLLYYAHISTEATSRRLVDMGVYTLIFQLYVPAIAVLDGIIYRVVPTWSVVLGGVCILVASMGVIAVRYQMGGDKGKGGKARRARARRKLGQNAARFGVISALACGGALYIDGEIGRNYIFRGGFSQSFVAPFLFYEMLTFAIPAFWSLIFLWLTVRKTVFAGLIGEFHQHRLPYALAALGSAAQFVFSVLALSLPEPRFIAAMILATSPLLVIMLDNNAHARTGRRAEYVMAAFATAGFLLMTLK